MTNKHTPGPWHIDWNGGMAPTILGVHSPGRTRHIAHVQFHNGSDDPEVHANALLLGAAPNLYEICKELSESMLEEDWPELFSAIAKAERKT